MLPVDLIRKVFSEVGATEKQILKVQSRYFAMGVGKERDDFLHSLEITALSQALFNVMENSIDIKKTDGGIVAEIKK